MPASGSENTNRFSSDVPSTLLPAHACQLTITTNAIVPAHTTRFDHRLLTLALSPGPAVGGSHQPPLYSATGSIVKTSGSLLPPQSNLPGSGGSIRTNLEPCTCMPTRHVLPTFAPTSIFGIIPLASNSCRFLIAVSRLARVIEFGSSPFAFIVSFTARAKISPETHAISPNPSGFLSYLRNAASSGLAS